MPITATSLFTTITHKTEMTFALARLNAFPIHTSLATNWCAHTIDFLITIIALTGVTIHGILADLGFNITVMVTIQALIFRWATKEIP